MKSAYELAMERLSKTAPTVKLSAEKKHRLAELDAEYKARVADREIFIHGQLKKAAAAGDHEAIQQLEKQLVSDRKSLQAELEAKKDQARGGK